MAGTTGTRRSAGRRGRPGLGLALAAGLAGLWSWPEGLGPPLLALAAVAGTVAWLVQRRRRRAAGRPGQEGSRRLPAGAGLHHGVEDPGPAPPARYDFGYLEAGAPDDLAAEPLARLEYVVLDTETTGLRPARDRVVSLAAVRIRAGKILREQAFDVLVRPGRRIPAASTRIHGITDAMVAGAPSLDEVLPAFLDFAGDAVLLGHDVWFDLAFLAPGLRRIGAPPLSGRRAILDTRLLAELVDGPLPADLDSLARRLGLSIPGRHSALGDALGVAEIFLGLLPGLERRGMRSLAEVLAASRALQGRLR